MFLTYTHSTEIIFELKSRLQIMILIQKLKCVYLCVILMGQCLACNKQCFFFFKLKKKKEKDHPKSINIISFGPSEKRRNIFLCKTWRPVEYGSGSKQLIQHG